MAKAMQKIRVSAAERKAILEEKERLITAALENNATTRKEISDQTKLQLWDINNVLNNNKELWAMYAVRRRTLIDVAADNIATIVNDKDHAQHFAASKYVLSKYKSDLDVILESNEEESIEIELGSGESGAHKTIIRFAKPVRLENEP